jgi:kinesin family protein C1
MYLAGEQDTDAKKGTAELKDLKEQLRVAEVARRKLHNLVQELRGNVRVFARVRPFLPNDGFDMTKLPSPTIKATADVGSLTIYRPAGVDERGEDQTFSFDKVFEPTATQEQLFAEVSEFVQSALDGYNVCLFSYGQTGSGKVRDFWYAILRFRVRLIVYPCIQTHTMQGSGNGSMRGVIPRAMEQVGIYKKQLEEKGWVYQMEVSFIEIYNETIRDLLRSGAGEDGKHEIKHGPNGTTVTDVCMRHVDPNNQDQIEAIMEQAARHRSVGKTDMNERSSRSHSVFCLHLKATNAAQGIVLKGTLSLVDLAGSERLDRSGATGDQLKETVAINKSLSALADVFVAIGNKQTHIPFRNSKLTYLLQPALSGDGKTLMMVNLSPTQESFQESLCSLRLAKQINQCELGKPKKQIKEASAPAASTKTANPVLEAITETPTPSKAVPNTPSRVASSKQMSASLSTASALAAASSSASATPQLMTASLGGRRAAPGSTTSATSASATAAKRLKK